MGITAGDVRGGQSPLASFCRLVGFNRGGGRGLRLRGFACLGHAGEWDWRAEGAPMC